MSAIELKRKEKRLVRQKIDDIVKLIAYNRNNGVTEDDLASLEAERKRLMRQFGDLHSEICRMERRT